MLKIHHLPLQIQLLWISPLCRIPTLKSSEFPSFPPCVVATLPISLSGAEEAPVVRRPSAPYPLPGRVAPPLPSLTTRIPRHINGHVKGRHILSISSSWKHVFYSLSSGSLLLEGRDPTIRALSFMLHGHSVNICWYSQWLWPSILSNGPYQPPSMEHQLS